MKDTQLNIRISQKEKEDLTTAAEKHDMNLTEFILSSAREKAKMKPYDLYEKIDEILERLIEIEKKMK